MACQFTRQQDLRWLWSILTDDDFDVTRINRKQFDSISGRQRSEKYAW